MRAWITHKAEAGGRVDRAWLSADRLGLRTRLAVRVNPEFEIKGSGMRMGGGAKPFGVDAERVPALVRAILDGGAEWRGFHLFVGSQALSADALIEAPRATLDFADGLAGAVGEEPPRGNPRGGSGPPN